MAITKGLFDADGHVYELDYQLIEYLDPPFRGRKELLRQPLINSGDGWHRISLGIGRGQKAVTSEEITAQMWLDALDEIGLEGTVLHPTLSLNIGQVKDPDWAVVVARGYNNWLNEKFLKVSSRLNGIAVLPIQNPQEAAKELRRASKELGMVGALMPAAGVNRLLGDPSYYPIYEAAQELDIALSVHTGGVPQLDMRFFDRLIDVRCLQHPIGQMHQMVNMMFGGVFDRFPDLRMAFLESGSAWVLCAFERMQREYEHWSALSRDLKKEPKEHLKSGRLYFEAELEDELLPFTAQLLGDKVLVFASDFPHFTRPDHISQSIKCFQERRDLSDATKRRILGENAKRLYNLHRVQ
jgi:predicted TIM-barrel fold metal-dependent hydrolase